MNVALLILNKFFDEKLLRIEKCMRMFLVDFRSFSLSILQIRDIIKYYALLISHFCYTISPPPIKNLYISLFLHSIGPDIRGLFLYPVLSWILNLVSGRISVLPDIPSAGYPFFRVSVLPDILYQALIPRPYIRQFNIRSIPSSVL